MTRRIGIVMLSAFIVALSSSWALAYDSDLSPALGLKLLDLLVVTPLSAGLTGISTIVYVATFPVTYALGVSEESERILVEIPGRFARARELGELDRYIDEPPVIPVHPSPYRTF